MMTALIPLMILRSRCAGLLSNSNWARVIGSGRTETQIRLLLSEKGYFYCFASCSS